MSDSNPLADRERALENAFFETENKKLIEKMHAQRKHEADRDSLATALGLESEGLLESLLKIGIREDNVSALVLAPLVVLAWADGKVDATERAAIRKAEAEHHIPLDGQSARLLDMWLEHRPHASLLGVWTDYIQDLCQHLSDQEREQLREDIVGRSQRLATALSKTIMRASGPTEAERETLAQIEAAFS